MEHRAAVVVGAWQVFCLVASEAEVKQFLQAGPDAVMSVAAFCRDGMLAGGAYTALWAVCRNINMHKRKTSKKNKKGELILPCRFYILTLERRTRCSRVPVFVFSVCRHL